MWKRYEYEDGPAWDLGMVQVWLGRLRERLRADPMASHLLLMAIERVGAVQRQLGRQYRYSRWANAPERGEQLRLWE